MNRPEQPGPLAGLSARFERLLDRATTVQQGVRLNWTVKRIWLPLLLVLSLIAGSTGYATGQWQCPDGTACVFTRGRGWHCQRADCHLTTDPDPAVACETGTDEAAGAEAGCDHEAHHSHQAEGAAVRRPRHCRYEVSDRPSPVALVTAAALLVQAPVAALLTEPVRLTEAVLILFVRRPILGGYPPGPSLPPPPNRGPPAL